MPQTIIQKLQNQNSLPKVQAQFIGDQKLSSMMADINMYIVYLPELVANFPIELIKQNWIWKSIHHQEDVNNYQKTKQHTYDILNAFIKHKTHYCFYQDRHYIPITPASIKDYIAFEKTMYRDSRINILNDIYHYISKVTWPSYYQLNDWLKQNNDYINENALISFDKYLFYNDLDWRYSYPHDKNSSKFGGQNLCNFEFTDFQTPGKPFDNYVYKADDVVKKYVDSDLFLTTADNYLLNQIHINPIFLNPRYFHGSFKLNGHATFAKNQIVKSDMLILIGSRTSNQISIFLYDKINKLLYLADRYNKSYF